MVATVALRVLGELHSMGSAEILDRVDVTPGTPQGRRAGLAGSLVNDSPLIQRQLQALIPCLGMVRPASYALGEP